MNDFNKQQTDKYTNKTFSFFVGSEQGELGVYDIVAISLRVAKRLLLKRLEVQPWTTIEFLG